MIASKNWTLNAAAAARKKFGGGLTGQSTTSTPWKFDSASRRNSTASGSKRKYKRISSSQPTAPTPLPPTRLPAPSAASQSYDLMHRAHNRSLPDRAGVVHLVDSNFISRMISLFIDMCWTICHINQSVRLPISKCVCLSPLYTTVILNNVNQIGLLLQYIANDTTILRYDTIR